MLHARQNLLNLWRARKGLIVLLLAGGLVCLLAAVAPQAWATPEQKPLAKSITDFNDNPVPPECIWPCDAPVEIATKGKVFTDTTTGDWFTGTIDVYITENTEWFTDTTTVLDPPGNVVVYHTTTVEVVNGEFDPNPAVIWDPPLPGYYDVFFDVDRDGLFEDGDGILGPEAPAPDDPAVGAGICIVPCVGGATVPGRWSGSVVPWIGLAALVGAGATVGLAWRRRRG
jgi:hypothetical protein